MKNVLFLILAGIVSLEVSMMMCFMMAPSHHKHVIVVPDNPSGCLPDKKPETQPIIIVPPKPDVIIVPPAKPAPVQPNLLLEFEFNNRQYYRPEPHREPYRYERRDPPHKEPEKHEPRKDEPKKTEPKVEPPKNQNPPQKQGEPQKQTPGKK